MYLAERAVSLAFRQALSEHFPALQGNAPYWKLTAYLMFSGWRDDDTGELLLPAEILAKMENKKHDSNYSARAFVERYSRDIARVTLREYGYEHCRRVVSIDWSPAVLKLAAKERRCTDSERVLMSDGTKWRREHQIKERVAIQNEALEQMENAGCDDARRLLSYLNNLPSNRFASVKKHLQEAHRTVDTLNTIPAEIERQHNILQAIQDQAQPFYKPAESTVRIFTMNESLLRLQTDVRKTVTQHWITADLKSAQLAIVAKVWDVPLLTAFLKTGRSIWQELCESLGLEYNGENKSRFKRALYAIIFGAGNAKLSAHFEESFPDGNPCLPDSRITL